MTEEIKEVKKNQLDTEDPYKPTGKSKKARHRLSAIDEAIEEIKKRLDNARSTLEKIADSDSKDEKKKKRSMVFNMSERSLIQNRVRIQ